MTEQQQLQQSNYKPTVVQEDAPVGFRTRSKTAKMEKTVTFAPARKETIFECPALRNTDNRQHDDDITNPYNEKAATKSAMLVPDRYQTESEVTTSCPVPRRYSFFVSKRDYWGGDKVTFETRYCSKNCHPSPF